MSFADVEIARVHDFEATFNVVGTSERDGAFSLRFAIPACEAGRSSSKGCSSLRVHVSGVPAFFVILTR